MALALKAWLVFVMLIMSCYAVRHGVFTLRRLIGRQRPSYQELLDGELPPVSVLIPMHNEELVADQVLDALLQTNYPRSLVEVIPIDDHSDDGTAGILNRYARRHEQVRPLYRRDRRRGKPAALNEAMAAASHEVVVVFDADYQPGADTLRQLVMAFHDPEVGAVMGRVVPSNTRRTILPRLLDLERSAGYQVDQQARYTLDLVPQYAGTVGGFRRSLVLSWGGFDPTIQAEDTDLTIRLYTRGWRVAYVNRAECYEEVPETWEARFRQLRRWARGHTQVSLRHWKAVLRSPYLGRLEKLEGMMLLGVYAVPMLIATAMTAVFLLLLSGDALFGPSLFVTFVVVAYTAVGNIGPFFQVGVAGVLDGMRERLLLVPFGFLVSPFNYLAVILGVTDAIVGTRGGRGRDWEKTERFRR